MGSIIGYLIIALVGVVLWANNWGFEIGILGILKEIFRK